VSCASFLVGGGSRSEDFSSDCGRGFLIPYPDELKIGAAEGKTKLDSAAVMPCSGRAVMQASWSDGIGDAAGIRGCGGD